LSESFADLDLNWKIEVITGKYPISTKFHRNFEIPWIRTN